jgi:CDP-2,3-bis-(O-geranylgeranyl)-sn-glycerol synthase
MAFGLDQVPESLLPLAVIAPRLGLTFTDVLQLTAAFLVIELLLSQALYRLHIRQQPY